MISSSTRRSAWISAAWTALLYVLLATSGVARADAGKTALLFTHTTGYRHESIPSGIAALRVIAAERGIALVASEDPAMFEPCNLERFDVVILLSATTDPKNAESEWLTGSRRLALQQFVRAGGGILAVHAAADSHYHWPWYRALIGGQFASHPPGTPKGTISLTDPEHPANAGLPGSAERTDEWYYFEDFDPTSDLLMTLDPRSIGEKDVNPNPIAWARRFDGGKVFYTAMGHTTESYSDPLFRRQLGNGLDWLAKP